MDAETRDRIERLQEKSYNSSYDVMCAFMGLDNLVPFQGSEGFQAALIDLLEKSDPSEWTDEQLCEWGLVRLPRDKDGVPVKVGDTIRKDEDGHTFRIDGFELIQGTWFAYEYYGIRTPVELCHRFSPVTVESVLREFANAALQDLAKAERESGMSLIEWIRSSNDVIAEYAKRLRLAEVDE
jgi:hypothetical protein